MAGRSVITCPRIVSGHANSTCGNGHNVNIHPVVCVESCSISLTGHLQCRISSGEVAHPTLPLNVSSTRLIGRQLCRDPHVHAAAARMPAGTLDGSARPSHTPIDRSRRTASGQCRGCNHRGGRHLLRGWVAWPLLAAEDYLSTRLARTVSWGDWIYLPHHPEVTASAWVNKLS